MSSAQKARINKSMVAAGVLLLIIVIASCGKQEKSAESQPQTQAAQKTFASPDDAAKALVDAAKANNRDVLLSIFGPESKDLIYSGDTSKDNAEFAGFVTDYDAMHRWRKLQNGSELLITGTDNKTFPIPLTKNSSGQWYFDTPAGKEEILSRRIGRDENAAIDICAAIATAQHQYFSQRHDGVSQYAQQFISDPGKQNGLYWQTTGDQPKSPLGPLVAYATQQGLKVEPNQHQPFYGYYFVMLDKQGADAKGGAKNYILNGKMTGGFAVVAYPAQYRDSGIMTFLVNQDGVVFENDLGKNTNEIAAAMSEFNPDKRWKPVEQ